MVILLLALLQSANAQTGMEKLNLMPDVKSYGLVSYEYRHTTIESSPTNRKRAETLNYGNTIQLAYAYQFAKQWFAGVEGEFGEDQDSGPRYGNDYQKRFSSQGFREPGIFVTGRLRPQEKARGNIDLFLHVLPSWEERVVGTNRSNQSTGRAEYTIEGAYGYFEDRWEFRTSLAVKFFGQGQERNRYTQDTYKLEEYRNVFFNFRAQYELGKYWYLLPGIGFYYQGTQDFDGTTSGKRSIQAGSGSVFEFGAKYVLDERSNVSILGTRAANDYFVRSDLGNFDGDERVITVSAVYLRGF